MEPTAGAVRQSRIRHGSLFILVMGFLLGVLVTDLAITPSRREAPARTSVGATAGTSGGSGGGTIVAGAATTDDTAAGAPAGTAAGTAAPGGTAAGSAAAQSTPAGGAQAASTAAGPAASGNSGASARGVTATSVKIGIAMPDTSVYKALNANFDSGDLQQKVLAVVDRWKRENKVPIAGRNVELVFKTVNPLDSNAQQSSCTDFIQTDQVFAVVAVGEYGVGVDCVAKTFKTPIISDQSANYVTDQDMQSELPYRFQAAMTSDRLDRNWIQWANSRGLLAGKKIGLYYARGGSNPDQPGQVIINELKKVGITPAVVQATDSALGGPDDQLAVQKFQAAGVNLAILPMSSITQSNFQRYAQAQGYKPAYIENDLVYNSDDFVASTMIQEQIDGTFALTARHEGEFGAHQLDPVAESCAENYERYSNTKLDRSKQTGFWVYTALACDQMSMLLTGLQAAGGDLTPQRFIAGLEAMNNVPMARFGNVTFSPTKHDGESSVRTIQYHSSCACYQTVGDPAFGPLFTQ